VQAVEMNGKPTLCTFAIRDIEAGEELLFDYGFSVPWPDLPPVSEPLFFCRDVVFINLSMCLFKHKYYTLTAIFKTNFIFGSGTD